MARHPFRLGTGGGATPAGRLSRGNRPSGPEAGSASAGLPTSANLEVEKCKVFRLMSSFWVSIRLKGGRPPLKTAGRGYRKSDPVKTETEKLYIPRKSLHFSPPRLALRSGILEGGASLEPVRKPAGRGAPVVGGPRDRWVWYHRTRPPTITRGAHGAVPQPGGGRASRRPSTRRSSSTRPR